jgi:hypothetical protein
MPLSGDDVWSDSGPPWCVVRPGAQRYRGTSTQVSAFDPPVLKHDCGLGRRSAMNAFIGKNRMKTNELPIGHLLYFVSP